MIEARNIELLKNYKDLLQNNKKVSEIRKKILEGDVIVFKNVLEKKLVFEIINYLKGIGRGSFPNYNPIVQGAPNFHRVNIWDQRSYVKGCFHQFNFFPWNQDVFNFFELTKEIFYLKNLLNNQSKEKFLRAQPEDGCVSRLSFQFYPKGIGGLNKHSDPVDYHQLTVPSLVMSKKGVDFQTGGFYVAGNKGDLSIEDYCDLGDVIFFNAQIPHGVSIIDESSIEDWLSFEGRWMMIFATNKLQNNLNVADAIDLES